jgi:replicative DNA helicase
MPECIGRIDEQHFVNPVHKSIYRALLSDWKAGRAIDMITFTQSLRDRRLLESIGGAVYLSQLFTFVPTATAIGHYLSILRDKHTLRETITICRSTIKRAMEEQGDVLEVVSEARKKILAIDDGDRRQRSIAEIVDDLRFSIGSEETVGVPTGFKSLDAIIGGLARGAKVVVAAPTSGGKSAFAANLACSLGIKRNVPTAIFTFEMNEDQTVRRLIQIHSGVSVRRDILCPQPDAFQVESFNQSADIVAASQIHVIKERLDVAGIRARCQQLKEAVGMRVAIIDYLQIVPEKRERGEGITERLDRMSAETKQIADSLGITVIELSQLTTDDKGNMTTRYSAGITNDADILLVIQGKDDDEKERIDKTVWIAKQRDGPKGKVEFRFDKPVTRFTEKKEQY